MAWILEPGNKKELWLRKSSPHGSWTFLAFNNFTGDQRGLGRIYFYGSFTPSGLELVQHFILSSWLLHGETEPCFWSQEEFEFHQFYPEKKIESVSLVISDSMEKWHKSMFLTGSADSRMIFVHLLFPTPGFNLSGVAFFWFIPLCVYSFSIHHPNLSVSTCVPSLEKVKLPQFWKKFLWEMLLKAFFILKDRTSAGHCCKY